MLYGGSKYSKAVRLAVQMILYAFTGSADNRLQETRTPFFGVPHLSQLFQRCVVTTEFKAGDVAAA